MPVNLALGHVSNDFLIAALVIYSLSVVAFAGDFAFGRPRRAAGRIPQERAAALAAVGAAGAAGGGDPTLTAGPAGVQAPGAPGAAFRASPDRPLHLSSLRPLLRLCLTKIRA